MRVIVPRRPLRLGPPRDDAAPDPRQPLVALNIFADVFDPSAANDAEAGIDQRVVASRRRARHRLAAASGTLSPDEANLWHPSLWFGEPATAQPHTTAAISANDAPDCPEPLHAHLARVRLALYADGPDHGQPATAPLSPQMRLAAYAMNATLVVVAFPVGAAVTTYSLLRGSDIRLSAQAIAVVASVLGIWQSGFEQLL
ncbi:hypothetical protein HYN69_11055 [Gemmobacter aquarius]|uniref:Uncharacterized protein n=1 Tax=Paragemmobacter aquarius TaxID=2169400 RepID=A0A2S0UMB3_9RHOB|nr:hypothetical protein [Gemmobacter aquarius]AWB48964.1 hypothetical protein HYN69_11055 [Gemmobacter aquarius]